ncbi:MAG: 16S rRNA (guanine(527)-N(7))-methyltransferase RsmG [Eubacteriales bacterium]|nr:16S rRNA (guanine(527)-N(7))-methyltransferase RsmG [Eubacteriales bacterium]
MTENFKLKLIEGCKKLGLELDELKAEKLYRYYELVVEKNKFMNLTAITEEDEFISKHFVDSLSIIKAPNLKDELTQAKGIKLIDVGTGAGFPGMVLKIVFPSLKITLFDSLKKRLNFLDEVIAELRLKDIETLHGRAEDYGNNKLYREKYDICVSRAVANMSALSEYCLPFVKPDGLFVAYKSGGSHSEIRDASKAIKILGGNIEDIQDFMLPDSDIERSMVSVRKIKKTPAQYPRKAGTPAKEPIK